MEKQQIIDTWDDVISAIRFSVDFFRSVFNIPVSNLLPYDSLLIPFSCFFYYEKENPIGDKLRYLREFFWRVSLSHRYSSATETKLAQDFKRIDKIRSGLRPKYDDIKVFLNSKQDLIDTNFSVSNSFCKATLCLLASNEPKDFRTNGTVFLDNSNLKVANSKNYHHFFPKAFLQGNGVSNWNSIVNITLVGADLNKRLIRARPPSDYIRQFMDANDGLRSSIKSHLIENIEEFAILDDDDSIFLDKRASLIFDALKSYIE